MTTEIYYSVPEVAEMFHVSKSKVYQWCEDGLVDHFRLGSYGRGIIRIPESAIKRFKERTFIRANQVRES